MTTPTISIIKLYPFGILIEIKYAQSPEDKKQIFKDFSQDLVLYATWEHLQHLIFLVYNSDKLSDPEALQKLEGFQEIQGKRFQAHIVLV